MAVAHYNPNAVAITVTPAADQHITQWINDTPQAQGLRLFTRRAGCSGLTYQSELITTPGEDDIRADSNAHVAIYVARDSISYLQALTIDFVKKELGQSMLTFINPNETARCGCGESFTV